MIKNKRVMHDMMFQMQNAGIPKLRKEVTALYKYI